MAPQDFVEDKSPASPEELAAMKLIQDRFLGALDSLGDEERAAIDQLFGLTNDGSRALEEVAATFGISTKRMVKIEAEALKTIRSQRTETFSGNP